MKDIIARIPDEAKKLIFEVYGKDANRMHYELLLLSIKQGKDKRDYFCEKRGHMPTAYFKSKGNKDFDELFYSKRNIVSRNRKRREELLMALKYAQFSENKGAIGYINGLLIEFKDEDLSYEFIDPFKREYSGEIWQ